jgi:hypothetical protein
MDKKPTTAQDDHVEVSEPGGSDGGWAPVPGVAPRTTDASDTESVTLEVDGETFQLRPDDFGGTHYTWLSGPNAGYGFSLSPTRDESLAEHRSSIRSFLAMIDPTTGYIEDD